MSASTIAALQKMYKTVYLGRDLANQSKRKTPAYDKVTTKYDDFDGEALIFPFNQDMPVSVSPVFAKGKANPKASTFDRWKLENTKDLYGFLTIDAKSMKRARKDIGAWLRLRQKETNEIRDYMKMLLGGHAFWGDGAGDIGQIASVTGANPITAFTLTNKRDAIKFHKNQRLEFNATRTGSVGTLKTVVYEVTGRNPGTGVITVSRVTGTTPDPAANDYVYLEGAYDAFPLGVKAFLPSADPGTGGVPATLLGMTRTDDVTMKSGFRTSWQGSIEETAKLLCADMGQYFDTQESALWLSRYNWFRLEQELAAQGRAVRDQSAPERFGSAGLILQTPEGDITAVSDPYAPHDAGYLLNNSTWETHHLDPLINISDDDGLVALRETDADGIEIRLRSWSENICQRPFMNGRIEIV